LGPETLSDHGARRERQTESDVIAPDTETGRRRVGFAMIGFAVALFSTVEVASKFLAGAVPPLRMAFFRFFISGLILAPVSLGLWRKAGKRFGARDFLLLGGLGAVGVTASIGLFHLAIHYLQANVAAIVFSTNPVFIALMAPLLLREPLTRRKMAAVALGLLGMAAFVADADGFSIRSTTGLLLMLGSVLGFALYTVMVKRCAPVYGAVEIMGFASLFGGALLLPLSWAREGAPWAPLSAAQAAATAYLTLVATAAAYGFYFLGLRRVDASRGAMFFFLKPALASLLAWLLLRERLTPWMAAGTALILSAMFLTIVPRFAGPMARLRAFAGSLRIR
jgi:drug/metabolite transporter (DMT)-like permease